MAIDFDQFCRFTKDGKNALSQIGLNFACKGCHVEGGKNKVFSDEDLRKVSFNYHARPTELPGDEMTNALYLLEYWSDGVVHANIFPALHSRFPVWQVLSKLPSSRGFNALSPLE